MGIERRRVTYEGRVQGVGFRMTARRLALAFPVVGFVRNLDDGRVELVAEGEADVLASYLGAVRLEFGEMILDVTERIEPAGDGSLSGFVIRH